MRGNLTPKKQRKSGKIQKPGKVNSEMLIFKAPSESRMRRTIHTTVTVNANASGAVTTMVDPTLLVTGSSDWASAQALFLRVKVERCEITFLPNFFHTSASPNYFGTTVAYYDPAASAIVSSYDNALDYVPHAIIHSSKPMTMALKLRNQLGTTTPIVMSAYIANFLGSMNFIAPNGAYTNSSSVMTVFFTFVLDFSEQK